MNRPFVRNLAWVLLAVLALGYWAWERAAPPALPGEGRSLSSAPDRIDPAPAARSPADSNRTAVTPDALPPQVLATLQRIQAGGPYPYRQDGGVFQNRERRLPSRPRGHYREFTVATPGARDRGARRIVTGGHPPSEYYYTDNHYRSFVRLQPATGGAQ